MLKIAVYGSSGQIVGEEQLDEKIFAVKAQPTLVHQVVVAEDANKRAPLAHTKTKGEVRGGGKKPWKQKGTGRARHGSIRSPQWRGGGIVFGPRKERNYETAINKKMRRKALLMTLSDKVATSRLIILDALEVSGRAKDWQKSVGVVEKTIGVTVKRTKSARRRPVNKLLLAASLSEALKRTTGNLPGLFVSRVDSLNVSTVLGAHYIFTTVEGLRALEKVLTRAPRTLR